MIVKKINRNEMKRKDEMLNLFSSIKDKKRFVL